MFECASGLNEAKSSILYSRNTDAQTKSEVKAILNFSEAGDDTR